MLREKSYIAAPITDKQMENAIPRQAQTNGEISPINLKKQNEKTRNVYKIISYKNSYDLSCNLSFTFFKQ